MSVNRYRPRLMVLPEDDANRKLADGFSLDESIRSGTYQVLPEAGGWREVLKRFNSDHVSVMERFDKRLMVLLIDFDNDLDRLNYAKTAIAPHLADRVFILGVLSEPEDLKAAMGPLQRISQSIAKDCREDTYTIWDHHLLRHNAGELARLREHVRPIWFQ